MCTVHSQSATWSLGTKTLPKRNPLSEYPVRRHRAHRRTRGIGPSAPFEHRFLQNTFPSQEPPRPAFANTAAEATGTNWENLAPTNIGGRIVNLAPDPHHALRASPSGELWRSTNAGRTRTNLGLRDSGAVAKIVVDPRNPRRIFAAASSLPQAPVNGLVIGSAASSTPPPTKASSWP